MSNQPRVAKVLAALLVSMTTGAIVLIALGDNSPSAGLFSLSSDYIRHFEPVEEAIRSRSYQSGQRWERIEIYYSGTKAGNTKQLSSLAGLADAGDINCHFVVCNGLGGADGQIQSTEKWQRQWPVIPDRGQRSDGQTIRICIVADGKTALPTNYQKRRTKVLVEELRRSFGLQAESVYYPGDWR